MRAIVSSNTGTVGWMAPELLNLTSRQTAKSDVYALGMTLYEIAFGVMPFANLPSNLVRSSVLGGARPTVDISDFDDVKNDAFLSGTEPMPELIEMIRNCWDADSNKRPHIDAVREKIDGLPSDERAARDFMLKILGRSPPPPQLSVSDTDFATSANPPIIRQPSSDDSGALSLKNVPPVTEPIPVCCRIS